MTDAAIDPTDVPVRPEPLSPSVGLGVLHLFFHVDGPVDSELVIDAVESCRADEHQVVTFAALGHKADLGIMALGRDLWRLRQLQTELCAAGLVLVDSYVSFTEVSEYAAGLPEDHLHKRLHPVLPPKGMRAVCFYPMSKRRGLGANEGNWFRLSFDERDRLMREHGASGRNFAGKVVQLVTGSAGLDDYEWGVTLFAHDPVDLKAVAYTLRFDEASAVYDEFGPFIVGMIADIDELCAQLCD